MYPILDQELDTLLEGYRSIHLAFFGIAFGALVTIAATYYSGVLPNDVHTRFFVLIVIAAAFSFYFGAMAIKDWFRSRELVKKLRTSTIDAIVKAAN